MCVKAPPLNLEPEEEEPEPVLPQEEPKKPEETVKIPENIEELVVVPDFVEKAELVIQNQCSLFVLFLCLGIYLLSLCADVSIYFLCFLISRQLSFSNLHENIANFICVILQFILFETLNSKL